MDKANVMKALALCNGLGYGGCTDCPYNRMDDCYKHMNDDAIALLKSTDIKPTYHTAIIYTKRTNLMPWLQSNYTKFSTFSTPEQRQSIRAAYEKERDVQLILLVRHEEGKCICRIKCPINPLPIKGEFVVTNSADVGRLLIDLGWSFKDKLNLTMFK